MYFLVLQGGFPLVPYGFEYGDIIIPVVADMTTIYSLILPDMFPYFGRNETEVTVDVVI